MVLGAQAYPAMVCAKCVASSYHAVLGSLWTTLHMSSLEDSGGVWSRTIEDVGFQRNKKKRTNLDRSAGLEVVFCGSLVQLHQAWKLRSIGEGLEQPPVLLLFP